MVWLIFLFFLPVCWSVFFFFFFNDTATTEIYTLSLHDALPIWTRPRCPHRYTGGRCARSSPDRKSTRLNSSHVKISYAVFCLKKKKNIFSRRSVNAGAKSFRTDTRLRGSRSVSARMVISDLFFF